MKEEKEVQNLINRLFRIADDIEALVSQPSMPMLRGATIYQSTRRDGVALELRHDQLRS